MKMKASTSRKLRYGGITAILTALIIALVLVANVIFGALAQKFLWYTDLTPEKLFTVSDACFDVIRNGDSGFEESTSPIEKVEEIWAEKKAEDPSFDPSTMMINIIFCDDEDKWNTENTTAQYVYYTALQLEKEFPEYINLEFVNIVHNPTRLIKYGAYDNSNVIIEFGSEYRLRTVDSFFVSNDEDSDPWAYNGEKIFASSIMAVTRAESPIACLTVGHGETLPSNELIKTLDNAGFEVQSVDLRNEEIPTNCRLLIVYNPVSDFLDSDDGVTEIDEIEKLDAYLDGGNSMMVFMSPDSLGTTRLDNFEDYLEEWGITYNRLEEITVSQSGSMTTLYHPTKVVDHSQSLSADGLLVEAEYVTVGLGGSVTEAMRESGTEPMMVFPNAMSISYSPLYETTYYQDEEDSSLNFYYGKMKSGSGTYRQIYDVFVTSENAIAKANGQDVAKATANDPLKLMTVTREDRYVTENEETSSSINDASYVFACGSSDFAATNLLQQQSYGNNAFLEYALRIVGQEPVPVGLTPNVFYDDTIDTITTAEATRYTVILTVIPAVAAIVCGVVVIVRRKYR